jgi:hypothetical protein
LGLLVAVLGVAAGLAAAVAETVALLWIATIPSVIGGVIMQIGVVAWGVRVGMRTARMDEYEASRPTHPS